MEENAPGIANLVNSIIGVSVLAMPYCMKQCGLILGLGLLLGASWLTYVSCSMLITSAVVKRRRTYEYLAYYTVGPSGKFAVELCMIGLMLGTCVAFYVIIGDLATGILSNYVEAPQLQLRTFVLVFCGLCIALPLGLMKSLAALGFIGFFSLVFYCIFVIVMFVTSVYNGLLTFEWLSKIELFRPAGIFQSLPIFSLAYACQCQLFVVYDSMEDASVMRMESIVSGALKIVTSVYCLVAIFGYTTFSDTVHGNVLQNLPHTFLLEAIKFGFAGSVVIGFPLMIFPCRQSIYTLFFKQQMSDGVPSKTYIEPFTFKVITLCIVLSTMTVAIFIPNVETILGITGATMGSFICYIFPAIIYSKAYQKADVFISRFVLAVGCLLLVVCTYQNLTAQPDTKPDIVKPDVINGHQGNGVEQHQGVAAKPDNPMPDVNQLPPLPKEQNIAEPVRDEHRHEPANPIEPVYVDKHESIEEKPEEKPQDNLKDSPKVEQHRNEPDPVEPEIKEAPPEGGKKDSASLPKEESQVSDKEEEVAVQKPPVGNQPEIAKEEPAKEEPAKDEEEPKQKDGVGEKKEEELLKQIKEQQEKQKEILQKQNDLLLALQEQHKKEHEQGTENEEKEKDDDVEKPSSKLPSENNEEKKEDLAVEEAKPVASENNEQKQPAAPLVELQKQALDKIDQPGNNKDQIKDTIVKKEVEETEEKKQAEIPEQPQQHEVKSAVEEPKVVEEAKPAKDELKPNSVVAQEPEKLGLNNVAKRNADNIEEDEKIVPGVSNENSEDNKLDDPEGGEEIPQPRELKSLSSYDGGNS